MILTGGQLYAPARPAATALAVEDGRISYLGDDEGARRAVPDAVEHHLGGRLVTPAFVDAHVHAVQTGQLLTGIDLHGAQSRPEVLDRVAAYARAHPDARVLLGQGWDEQGWADPRPPTRAELDRAAGDVPVYLSRVDVHSALISSALLAAVPELVDAVGYRSDGRVSQDAHHRCRATVNALSSDAERRAAARAALASAASLGVAAVHEMGGPHLGPLEDLLRVRDAGAELGVEVVGYWGELAGPAAFDRARRVGAAGLAGDLCVDGALGSHTAALSRPYADAVTSGVRYLSDEEILGHLLACTRAGVQAGFHCIGDDAVAAAVAGLRRTAEILGTAPVRAARHRLEHVEMIGDDDVAILAELDVTVSGQPAFDAAWGGPAGLYAARLGPERARPMNPWRRLRQAGVRLAFGTDAPVTPLAGWSTIAAAVRPSSPEAGLTVVEAFAAATRGARGATFSDDVGDLAVGQRASLAVWALDPDQLDPGSGLPILEHGAPLPACVATMASGQLIFNALDGGIPTAPDEPG